MNIRESTVCFSDYIVRCPEIQDRALLSVNIGMEEDLQKKEK